MDELKANTDPMHVKLRNIFTRIGQMQEKSAQERTERSAALVDATATQIFLLTLVSVVLSCVLGALVIRSTVGQIGGEPAVASLLAEQIASGDLTRQLPLKAGDDKSLMFHLGAMQARLIQVISGVREAAGSVIHSSTEIAQGNNDLSQRTEQQAGALQATASTVAQFGSSAGIDAGNARTPMNWR